MLDFTELGGNGRGLEQLTREIALVLGLNPQWSGEGPDGGRDLTLVEPGIDLLGGKPRQWLVSCKDNSSSGKSVGIDAVNGLIEAVKQHGATGFLLACATHPSAAVTERLAAIERNEGIACHTWDGVTLERLLSHPATWPLAQRFMPASSQALDWRIFGTSAPNDWVGVHRGHFLHLRSRTGSGMGFDLASLSLRFDELEAVQTEYGAEFRVREVFHDDTHGGGYVWAADCLWDEDRTAPTPAVLSAALKSGIAREDGQFHVFEFTVQRVNRASDHFDRDHYSFYPNHHVRWR